jgi:hypothetical protein
VFHNSMILFHNIIQILTLSELAALWECAVVLEGVEGQWVCGVLVDGNHVWEGRMARAQYLPETLFGGIGITGGTQHEV